MKKFFAAIICLVMLVTALPVTAFSLEEEKLPVEVLGVKCTDNRPVSLKEIADYNIEGWPFFLAYSNITYNFEVLLSDGTSCFEKVERFEVAPASDTGAYALEKTPAKAQSKKVGVFCEPYVLKQDCLDAVAQGRTTVPLYVIVHFSYYDDEGKMHPKEYRFTTEKEIAPSFAEIKPVLGLPEYINEASPYADFDNALFEIRYWDGRVKQEKAVDVSYGKRKSDYTLDGEKLSYHVNEKNKQIKITYADAEYTHSVNEVKECPFSSVKITDCKFDGDCLKEISYELTKKDGTTVRYTKEITNPYPDIEREVDFIDGYVVRVSAYRQKNWSGVEVYVTRDISDNGIFAHETDNIFKNILARIYVFFLRIYARITGADY